jgi:hypothetical protein
MKNSDIYGIEKSIWRKNQTDSSEKTDGSAMGGYTKIWFKTCKNSQNSRTRQALAKRKIESMRG